MPFELFHECYTNVISAFPYLVLVDYVNMYVVDPGETIKIESATADPIGLKVGIAYDYDSSVRKYIMLETNSFFHFACSHCNVHMFCWIETKGYVSAMEL